jgi:hypothetical protein
LHRFLWLYYEVKNRKEVEEGKEEENKEIRNLKLNF